ncbi:MAG TPA: POTRA domain-containing protein [Rhizomicrobium sp.]|jgi:hemolysin activation/secretion protein
MRSAVFTGARRLRGVLLGSVGIALLLSTAISAQAADAAPGATAPSAAATAPAAKPAAPVRKFEINEFDVEGNTVLDEAAIDAAVEPFMGPDRTMADIDGARGALEKAYAAKGYQTVYVTLPPQTVRGGVVRLKAVETTVGTVTVNGQSYVAPERVQKALPSLAPGAVPNLPTLNKELVALNSQSNDLQVTPAMKQGAKPDTIDVSLDVQDKLAVHGGLELNNKYSRDTSPLRLQANIEYDDLWGLNHSLSGLYSVAPQDRNDGEVYALTYSAPLPGTDLKLSLTGLNSNSNVNTLGGTNVLGKGYSITAGLMAPLGTVGDDYFHYLQANVAWKDFNDTVSLGGQSSPAPIKYVPLSLTYFGSLRKPEDQFSVNAGLTVSLRGLGSNHDDYDVARYRADGDFFYAKGGVSWLHNFPHGIDLFASLDGQIANGPLISNEQYSIGGEGTVRGYLQSEGLGDDGIHSSLELRSPSLAPWMGARVGKYVDDFRFVLFADAARAWLHDPLPQQQDYFNLRSVGIGVTGQVLKYLNGSLYLADPLDSTTGPNSSGVTQSGHLRLQFRVWTQF